MKAAINSYEEHGYDISITRHREVMSAACPLRPGELLLFGPAQLQLEQRARVQFFNYPAAKYPRRSQLPTILMLVSHCGPLDPRKVELAILRSSSDPSLVYMHDRTTYHRGWYCFILLLLWCNRETCGLPSWCRLPSQEWERGQDPAAISLD